MITSNTSRTGPISHALAFSLAGLGVVCGLFWSTGRKLVEVWVNDDNYNHGFIVPVLSLFFAWRIARGQELLEDTDTAQGWLGIVAGGLVHLVAAVFGWVLLDFLALMLVLRGWAMTLGGKDYARSFWFPILFLFFMFPLPFFITNWIALGLQKVVTVASGIVLDALAGCTRMGNELSVVGISESLKVGQECSGIRQMVAFVGLGCVVAHLRSQSALQSVLFVGLALPIALLTNIVRVLLMAAGMKWFGADWPKTSLHDVPALVTMPLGLVVYLLIAQLFESGDAKEGPR